MKIEEVVKNLLKIEDTKEFIDEGSVAFHHTTGRSIRNSYNLWENSSLLHKEFNAIGIYHPDDMSGIILETVHRILTGKKIDLKGQVEKYKKYWKMNGRDMKGNEL